ncbi:zinc finger BED domain-containing protein RICESLEEPER 2-like protein [Tanacetum coccineum]|uniref:Zinc finger BED domain-containing protein RICESLEEPER 2-like protein n=1 Tax=Tanacetum coccineum TaxID=301880 RepID=A0ABQ5FV64_9ASTR
MYQEEREEHVNVENVVELESTTEEKPKKTRATRKRSLYSSDTKIHGTSTLRGHLKTCDKFPGNMLDGQTHLSIQKGDGDERKMIAWKFDQKSVRRALSYRLIVDELPFKFVEGKGFKHFLNATQPLFHTPSRITMARDCMKLFLEEKKKVGVLLSGNVGRICLTTDTWTSLQRINYMCLTAHYIDNDWGIESNVFTITVDNASANDVAVAYLKSKFANREKFVLEGKWLHVRCTAHVMNLIVQDGLSHIGKSVDCVRAAEKYIRQSPQRLAKFKEYAEIEKCPSTKSLILDVPTRWNSTYLMLDTIQSYERAFARYDSEERHYRDDLEKTGVPISSDWANVRRLTKFLEHFYQLTLKVSGTLYVTSNSFLDDITSIDAALNNCINGIPANTNLAAMAKMMKCKFDKYYGSLEKCNMATVVPSVLDPRNKFEYVEVLLGDVYGKIKGKAMCAMIKASLVELYEDYVRIHASPETDTMFESVDASSSMNKRSATQSSVILKQKVRMEMKRRKFESGMHDSKSELDRYLNEDVEDESDKFDILNWWKVNSPRFPVLSLLARDVLAIPISTVASESVFSTSGRVLDAFRSPVVEMALKLSHDDLLCSFRRAPRAGAEELQYIQLVKIMEGITLFDSKDRWRWSLKGCGEFTVSSVRNLLDANSLPVVSSKTRWIKAVPIKVNIHAWKVKLDILPTRLNISKRSMDIESILCPLCEKNVESSSHIFFTCPISREIFRKVLLW